MKIVYLSWCIVALIWLLKYRKPTFRALLSAHLSLLGFIGLYYLLLNLFDLFAAIYSGYFYEQMAFFHRVFGRWMYSYLLYVGILVPLTVLNLFRKIRRNTQFQFLIGTALFVFSLGGILLEYVLSFDKNVIPGWNTIIVPRPYFKPIPIFIIGIVFIDLLLYQIEQKIFQKKS